MNNKTSHKQNDKRLAISDKQIYDAIIVGAGPAGLMAAIQAPSKDIMLLEKNDIPGKKLLISGKGRCNITNNTDSVTDFLSHFSLGGKFLRNAFNMFFTQELMSFFSRNNVPLKTERGKRVFPESNRSRDVLSCLLKIIKEKPLCLRTGTEADTVSFNKNGFFEVHCNNTVYLSKKVLLCTGGLSYPVTGSTGKGLIIAKKIGHTIINTKPALVGIETSDLNTKKWQAIALKNVTCSVFANNKKQAKAFGEMLFTHYGLSGPIILDLSATIYDLLEKKQKVSVSIDLKPALDHTQIQKRLLREFSRSANKKILTVIKELLPGKMSELFLKHIHIDPDKKVNQITTKERTSVAKTLKDLCFNIKRTRPLKEAIITRGGICTKEIDPKTMESKLVKGLYFAGEIIDVDAKTGGYNLQACFSTGYLAGKNL